MVQINTKSNKKYSGFTIVELLVVIVVIGILAAITVVSYTGISTKANTAANKQDANSVVSSALAYYTDNSSAFPTTLTVATFNTNNTAKLPSDIVMTGGVLSAGSTIQFLKNTAGTGICVGYWDYGVGGGSAQYYYGGAASAGVNAATPTCA